ncbi:carbohydrate ABC transporter permease [Actinomadura rupiterrae]|uniref:carbohydrate ABC transporter permease n=1 Tax=Actinomadura rupiterrae TaxID=559627 RepID=UPI0020A537A4|nr:sugar ABC transporter permease [Actinomadura rupiterrae]MCP2336003.1 glucose/mannose transport system permease protein [Actinomadura rupiterrae]
MTSVSTRGTDRRARPQGGPPGPLRRLRRAGWLPGLLLVAPSIAAIGLFVYGLIFWNVRVAVSGKHDEVSPYKFDKGKNFVDLWHEPSWPGAVRHALLFTVVFVGGALILGAFLAFLMEKGIKGEAGFRIIYLFPMAISFIASGVVWRWLMNPAPADRAVGLNQLFHKTGLGDLANSWWQDKSWGMAAMAIPAIWQMSGYVMALYLAGFRSVSEDLREAARVDGASEWQVYRYVVFPQLRPVTLSALIILGHISLKVFDLIMAIAGKQIITYVPAIATYVEVFDRHDPANGATIATYLLLAVAVLVIPYLVWSVRTERNR